MASTNLSSFLTPLQGFAQSLTNTYESSTRGQPEDQLKPPVVELLREFGAAMNLNVSSKLESAVEGIGRPDVAVDINDLLCGYIELKAPGTGANATKFKGHNREQWKKFSSLPNLIYTDGNEWILYRTGEHMARVMLSGDAASDGSGAVDADVAILDTGIYNHKDLNRVGGYNCTSTNRKAYGDGNGHGTHAAGTAAAKDNDLGVVGTAPGARLQAVKVLGKDGSGSFSSVICGVDWVTGKAGTIEVANMSLGAIVTGTDDGNCGWTGNNAAAAMHRAICGSVDAGVTYAVAAGNDNIDFATTVPAAFDEVLTVTAMSDFDGESGGTADPTCREDNLDDTAASFSNFTTIGSSDAEHTIAAPGVCIRSTWKGDRKRKNGTYKIISGTSMASPPVAGTIALCIASGDCTGTPASNITRLRNDAEAKSDPLATPYYGYLEYAGGY